MGGRVDGYRVELRGLKRSEPYLKKHSGLPGPRANLELVQAVGDEADSGRLCRFSASADEFLALCGTAGRQRAAAAGLCEPDLLRQNSSAVQVLAILDRITISAAAATERRNGEDFKVLRQALGYCWSVAAAAAPENAQTYFEKWLRSTDKDVAWIMRSNLGKARMAGLREKLSPTRPAPAKPKPKPKATTRT